MKMDETAITNENHMIDDDLVACENKLTELRM